jgi:hypothetical protein
MERRALRDNVGVRAPQQHDPVTLHSRSPASRCRSRRGVQAQRHSQHRQERLPSDGEIVLTAGPMAPTVLFRATNRPIGVWHSSARARLSVNGKAATRVTGPPASRRQLLLAWSETDGPARQAGLGGRVRQLRGIRLNRADEQVAVVREQRRTP